MAKDDPSTRFPFINLEKSLAKAQKLFLGDKSGKAMSVTVAFELWGYSPKSSGGQQTVSALKQYGLIDADGANSDRKIKLTDLARRFFLDERDETRSKMLAEFALNPPLINALWFKDNWKDGLPADTVARSHLKIDRNLNDQSARALLSIFKDNLSYAGLKAMGHDDGLELETIEIKDEADLKTPQRNSTETPAKETQISPQIMGTQTKPIIFDMESVSVSARFETSEDLDDFIEKLQRLKPLLPSKLDT